MYIDRAEIRSLSSDENLADLWCEDPVPTEAAEELGFDLSPAGPVRPRPGTCTDVPTVRPRTFSGYDRRYGSGEGGFDECDVRTC